MNHYLGSSVTCGVASQLVLDNYILTNDLV